MLPEYCWLPATSKVTGAAELMSASMMPSVPP